MAQFPIIPMPRVYSVQSAAIMRAAFRANPDIGIAMALCFIGLALMIVSPFTAIPANALGTGDCLFWMCMGYVIGRATR